MRQDRMTDCDCFLREIVPAGTGRGHSEADIFGPSSSVEVYPAQGPAFRPGGSADLWETQAFEGIVIGICLLSVGLAYRYGNSIVQVFKIFFRQFSFEKAFEEQSLFFRQFLSLTTVWCLLLGCGLLIRLIGTFMPESAAVRNDFIFSSPDATILIALAAGGSIVAYRRIVVRTVAALIRKEDFFREYRFETQIFLALACCLLTPPFLVIALSSESWARNLSYGVAALTVLFVLLYLVRSCRFFVERKVSILRWILYLCVVEIFPISFFILAVSRGS